MKILIEASEVYRNHTGIGRFSRELLAHLPPGLDLCYSPADFGQRSHSVERRTFARRIRHFGEHMLLTQGMAAWTAHRQAPDVTHSLSFFAPLASSRPSVITIFDLAYFDLPGQTDAFWGRYARRMMPIFARKAAAIVTSSDVMKNRIQAAFGLPPDKVHRVYAGVSAQFHPEMEADEARRIRQRYAVNQAFVLYSGAWRANKNLPVLFQAFAGIKSHLLVLTGVPEPELLALANRLNVPYRCLGHVPDEDMPALYRLAEIVVMPSLYEGFGLPVLEAMACGTPVVIADIPVLAEVAGHAAVRFAPSSPEQLREVLLKLLNDAAERERLRALGLLRAAQFRWTDTAAGVVELWKSVAAA